jgi:maleamate amidohydrolase
MYDDQTHRTYEQAGFGASLERGARPVLLVVDLSRGFTEARFPTGADLSDVVAATNRLIHAGHEAGVPVIFTTVAYADAELDGDMIVWLRKAPGLRALVEGTETVEIDPRLARHPSDAMIVKKGASAFHATGLAATLVALGADTVVLCGATTSGCVRASAVDAIQLGFPVLVPRQCVGDRARGAHDANLYDIQAKYGDVIEVDDAERYLAARGSSDA